jgi:hypothetical protein
MSKKRGDRRMEDQEKGGTRQKRTKGGKRERGKRKRWNKKENQERGGTREKRGKK